MVFWAIGGVGQTGGMNFIPYNRRAKRGSDGKMRLFYNKPIDPENPTTADKENALVLPDDPLARYRLVSGFFGVEDRFVNMFTKQTANKMGSVFTFPNYSSDDKNINITGSKSNLGRNVRTGLDPQANIKNRENSKESSKEKGVLDNLGT